MEVEKRVYVFGNEFLEEDSFAHEVAQHLQEKIEKCRSPDDLLLSDQNPLVILDVVKNSKKVMMITDINQLKTINIIKPEYLVMSEN